MPDDTVLGGAKREFPTTIWSQILKAGGARDEGTQERFGRLLHSYWKPVYAYIRGTWHKPVEDAKDLTQAFFAHLLEKDFFSRVAPERGTFRSYLKRALKNFVIDVERAAASRRPEKPVFSLEAAPGELERLGPSSPNDTPEQAYDRAWFDALYESAIGALKESLINDGKAVYFDVFRIYCVDTAKDRDVPTYKAVAARLGIKETAVRNYLAHCRRALLVHLRERIREYADSEGDVDRELEIALKI